MDTATQEKPTVLWIHGAWHTTLYLQPVVRKLEAEGYPVICPQLESTNYERTPVTLVEDAQPITDILRRLVEGEGKTVLVAMHSYGGMVGTEAVIENLYYSKRKAAGEPGGVAAMFYCAGVMPELGASLEISVGGSLPPWIIQDESKGLTRSCNEGYVFYNDLPEDVSKRLIGELRTHSLPSKKTPTSRAPYLHLPTTYIMCEKDNAIPTQAQEAMVQSAQSKGAHVRAVRCPASHTPMVSQPDLVVRELIATIQQAVIL